MTFDIIILSYSKTDKHIKTTNDCIKSLLNAKNKVAVNVTVIESYNKKIRYNGVKNVFYQQPKFNYNNSMNYGASITNNDYVFFCNNDLVFYDGWADNCYYAFKMGYKSVSTYCPTSHSRYVDSGDYVIPGYRVGFHVSGWCIGVERKMFNGLGGFNDAVDFWYSDNLYAEQLKVNEIKHGLVCSSIVRHLDYGSKTLNSLDGKSKKHLTHGQKGRYDKAVKELWDAKR